jgi:hypothetical protein
MPACRLVRPAGSELARTTDERAAIERHLRELDRLGEDLELLDREFAERNGGTVNQAPADITDAGVLRQTRRSSKADQHPLRLRMMSD